MKVLAIMSSPREHSASSTYGEYFLDELQKKRPDCQIKKYYLRTLNYQGCQACYKCQTTIETRCALNDGLTTVFSDLIEADILFIATPIYFDNVPSQLKAFLDRCNQFYIPDYLLTVAEETSMPKGKILVMINTQEQSGIRRYRAMQESFHFYFKRFGFAGFHFLSEDLLSTDWDLSHEKHRLFFNSIDDCVNDLAEYFKHWLRK